MKRRAIRRWTISYLTSRWPLADLLNRSDRNCWADLVSWALGSKTLRESVDDATSCRVESAIRGNCYCGKFTNGDRT